MPSTIQSFFATIDSGSPPPSQPWDSAFRQNRSHQDETFKLKLLRWRRRVLPPGLPAVHSKVQRHRLATKRPYAGSLAKDRLLLPTVGGRSVDEPKASQSTLRHEEAEFRSCVLVDEQHGQMVRRILFLDDVRRDSSPLSILQVLPLV